MSPCKSKGLFRTTDAEGRGGLGLSWVLDFGRNPLAPVAAPDKGIWALGTPGSCKNFTLLDLRLVPCPAQVPGVFGVSNLASGGCLNHSPECVMGLVQVRQVCY